MFVCTSFWAQMWHACHRGDEIARLISGLFCASSKRRTMTSHLVDLQMCFDCPLIASENKVRPAARSTASTDGMSSQSDTCAL